jgi:recombination protein RecT
MATTTSIEELRASKQDREAAVYKDMKPKEKIGYLLNQKKAEISALLPKHVSPDRLLKVAQIAATTTPALAECDVASLVGSILQCAQMGLEPNTVMGHAYLVPFNTKRKDAEGNERWVKSVQVIVGYKGLIDLARRSGQIVSIAAHEVCENDTFVLSYGLEERLDHVPAMGERGDVLGFYAVAHMRDGGHCFEFMSRLQVEQIRDASQSAMKDEYVNGKKTGRRIPKAGPWWDHFVEMGRKTVIRRLAKYLPLSIEFASAVALDAMAATGKDQKPDTFDGVFTSMDEDTPAGDDADEAPPQLTEQPSVTIPQNVNAATGEWTPSPEELAEIKARELAEAVEAQPAAQPRTKRAPLE